MLNVQQNKAVQQVLDGHSLLLLGAAGTGKSFTIKIMVEQCQERNLNVSLTCTTGIACCVIQHLFWQPRYTDGVVSEMEGTIHQILDK